MMRDTWVRIAFYLAEAAVLSVPLVWGFLLAGRAARRFGTTLPALSWQRILALVLGLTAVDAAIGELAGPHVILQYYASATILAAGAGAWILSRALTALAVRRRAP